MISTRDLTELPDLDGFRRLTKSLATLDAILSPEWADRYYSFDTTWTESEMLASMRNGSGDKWFAVICQSGVALQGLAHEAPSFRTGEPQPWVFRDLPAEFHENLLKEPAADTANTTFCIWRLSSDPQWKTGIRREGEDQDVDDGSAELLSILNGDPRAYVNFAMDYYEVELRLEDVQAVYRHERLTHELVMRLNDEADVEQLRADLKQIGYPDGHRAPSTLRRD